MGAGTELKPGINTHQLLQYKWWLQSRRAHREVSEDYRDEAKDCAWGIPTSSTFSIGVSMWLLGVLLTALFCFLC